MEKMEKELIESCLENWLGYGNINSLVWFLGIEEGGAEINGDRASDSEKAQQLTLEESLKLRQSFDLCEDFYEVWRKKYGCDLDALLKKPTTWKFIAAILLSMRGDPITSEGVKNFITYGKSFGTKLSNHFFVNFTLFRKGV